MATPSQNNGLYSESLLRSANLLLVDLSGRALRHLSAPERAEAIRHLLGHRPWYENLSISLQVQVCAGVFGRSLSTGPLFELLNSQRDLKTWHVRVATPLGNFDYTTSFSNGMVHLQLLTDVEHREAGYGATNAVTTNTVDLLKPLADVTMGAGGHGTSKSGSKACPPLDLTRLASEVVHRGNLNSYTGTNLTVEAEILKVRHALSTLVIKGAERPLTDFTFLPFDQGDFTAASQKLADAQTSKWQRPYAVCIFIVDTVDENGEIVVCGKNGQWSLFADQTTVCGTSGPYLVVAVADSESIGRRSMVAAVCRGIAAHNWLATALSGYERKALLWAQPHVVQARRTDLPVILKIQGKETIGGTVVFPDLTFQVADIRPRLHVEVRGFDDDNTLDPEYTARKDRQEAAMRATDEYHAVSAAEARLEGSWLKEYIAFDRAFLKWTRIVRGVLAARRRK